LDEWNETIGKAKQSSEKDDSNVPVRHDIILVLVTRHSKDTAGCQFPCQGNNVELRECVCVGYKDWIKRVRRITSKAQ